MTNRRYSKESQQEHRSKAQLTDRLTDFGWIPVSPPDFGEDFIVSVYHDGEATGINFYIQEKSVKNIDDIRVNDSIKYRINVSDLKHWETFSLPVVLIIWDINSREGRWILIKDIINTNNESKPNHSRPPRGGHRSANARKPIAGRCPDPWEEGPGSSLESRPQGPRRGHPSRCGPDSQ